MMRPEIERRIRQLRGRSDLEAAMLLGYDTAPYPFANGRDMMVLGAPHKLIILSSETYNERRRRAWAVADALGHLLVDPGWKPEKSDGKLDAVALKREAAADEVSRWILANLGS